MSMSMGWSPKTRCWVVVLYCSRGRECMQPGWPMPTAGLGGFWTSGTTTWMLDVPSDS